MVPRVPVGLATTPCLELGGDLLPCSSSLVGLGGDGFLFICMQL